MTGEPLEPDHEPEEELEAQAAANRYLVTLWEGLGYDGEGVMRFGCFLHLQETLREVVDTPREENVIDVWLQSYGGSAHEAYRYMLLFREHAATVRVVVGQHAKSAATLMILGADTIYMAPTSDLGPLDAQVWSEEEGRAISALDIARSIEHLAYTAFDLALSGGGVFHEITGIPRREVLPALLSFSSDFVQPIVAKLEPSSIYRASSQLNVAQEYAQRLLSMLAEPWSERKAKILTDHLVNDYPDHGFIISFDEAEALDLPVRPLKEYENWPIFAAMGEALNGQGRTVQGSTWPEPAGEDHEDDEESESADHSGAADGTPTGTEKGGDSEDGGHPESADEPRAPGA